ncbi:hypothetical protein BgAZ_303790 [Babesia gibsoni]|uniref:KHDC4/BBP-like KH-domain type I domain-containing protein n=1 Tax=Babesia gibsoni TaxID=33632 RepID=A0AAD8PDY4_BABGI|nr:hypothetical protein BgAZ_303790 [Babesia gibsoni]
MVYQPYPIQGSGGYIDPNMFHVPMAGMPPPFIPVATQMAMPAYPVSMGAFGNMPAHSSDSAHHKYPAYGYDMSSASKSRNARPRAGRQRMERGFRLAVFVERAKGNFHFVKDDIMELFSYFGGVASLSIKDNIAAAEVTLPDSYEARIAIDELNNLEIHGVGTLRCVEIKKGDTLNYVLAKSCGYEKQYDHSHSNRRSLEDSKRPRSEASEKPSAKRMARFELVDLFTYEPEFDVASHILGNENANIEYIMRNAQGKVDITITGKPLNSAPVAERLHVSLSSDDMTAYRNALNMLEELLTTVCENFVDFVQSRGQMVAPTVGFSRHEYRTVDGSLKYMGVREQPKTWLTPAPSVPPYKGKPQNGRSQQRKVNDRSRGVNKAGAVPKVNGRLAK